MQNNNLHSDNPYCFFLYILECKDKSYYIGHTDNIDKRLIEHRKGMSHYTSKRLPVALVYQEEFSTRDEAFVAERKLKRWTRKKKQAYIQKNFALLHKLAKSKFD